jgi:hypothetical protein
MARRLVFLALLFAGLSAASAAPAEAWWVFRDGDGGTLYGARREVNVVSVAYDTAARVYVIEDAAGINTPPGPFPLERHGCTRRSRTMWPARGPTSWHSSATATTG